MRYLAGELCSRDYYNTFCLLYIKIRGVIAYPDRVSGYCPQVLSIATGRLAYNSVIDRKRLTQKEVLGTAQGIKMFAEWAPKTELFIRSKKMRDGEEA